MFKPAFNSFADFLAMDGYGFYVWLVYGFATATFSVIVAGYLFRKKQVLKQLQQTEKINTQHLAVSAADLE